MNEHYDDDTVVARIYGVGVEYVIVSAHEFDCDEDVFWLVFAHCGPSTQEMISGSWADCMAFVANEVAAQMEAEGFIPMRRLAVTPT